ncbi:MAG: T9SS type A sorting domain-containing protein, partial [Flavobacteriales bacterium]
PDSWETTNVSGSVEPVTQTDDAHSGNYAVHLAVVSAFSFSVPGAITQMEFPISYIPQSMSFWLKSNLTANSQVYGAMSIFDSNGNVLGAASFSTTTSSSTYFEFIAPTISTGATGTPVSASITISMSTTDGSTLGITNNCTIDDISISSVPLSIVEPSIEQFSIYPNPCSVEMAKLDLTEIQGQVDLNIFDLQGKMVLSESVVGGLNHSLCVSELPAGFYMVKVMDGTQVFSTKLIIE